MMMMLSWYCSSPCCVFASGVLIISRIKRASEHPSLVNYLLL
uniref:Uncharacterized protein n=1 Tax=Arundo donax TaxID=35708 RepID=A0A0A8Z7W6_ARUDO